MCYAAAQPTFELLQCDLLAVHAQERACACVSCARHVDVLLSHVCVQSPPCFLSPRVSSIISWWWRAHPRHPTQAQPQRVEILPSIQVQRHHIDISSRNPSTSCHAMAWHIISPRVVTRLCDAHAMIFHAMIFHAMIFHMHIRIRSISCTSIIMCIDFEHVHTMIVLSSSHPLTAMYHVFA